MNAFAGIRAATPIALAVALAATAPAFPDAFPSRPIHLIVNFAPGGTGDIVARLVGNKLSSALGQSVVVENRPGAGGTLGARDVVNAEPDGYTLTVAQTPEIAINPFFMKDAGYDPRKDLQAIALAGVVPLALVVPGNAPYSTMAEFVKFLRTTDQAVTFASAGIGTPGHLAGELLKLKLNNKITHVPYKGAAPALNDVVGGHVDFYFPGFPAAMPLMQGGTRRRVALNLASVINDLAVAGRPVSDRCPIRSPPASVRAGEGGRLAAGSDERMGERGCKPAAAFTAVEVMVRASRS
jgi:tripartite-type tricarboxylate transporter receptor subunit TctC